MSFKKNTAVTGFAVGLTSSTDGSDITTGTPVGYYTLDGGTQTAIGDVTPVHEGNGLWTFGLTAAEMNGDIVGLTFTHTSAITAHFTIKTDTKITSELNDFNSATDAVATVTTLTNLPAITTGWLTATGIAASALDGKGNWNIGKTGYTLTQSFPANFAALGIAVDGDLSGNIDGNVVGSVASVVAAVETDTASRNASKADVSGLSTFDPAIDAVANVTLVDTTTNVTNLASGTAGISIQAVAFVNTAGGTATNLYTDTYALDGTTHDVAANAGATDFYYEFNIGGNGIPLAVEWEGYANSNGDSYIVEGYDYGATNYVQVGEITASNVTVSGVESFIYPGSLVGSGVDSGKVRFRIISTDGTNFSTDRVLLEYTISNAASGYVDGAVWFDSNASNTGTELDYDGTFSNPVSSEASARTIADGKSITSIQCTTGSTYTLDQSYDSFMFSGINHTIALNGQSFDRGSVVQGIITGNDDGSNPNFSTYDGALLGPNTLGQHALLNCFIGGTITLAEAGVHIWTNCVESATGAAGIDFGAALNASTVYISHYQNRLEIENMGQGTGTYVLKMSGFGEIDINANCVGGTITLSGSWEVTGDAAFISAGGVINYDDVAQGVIDTHGHLTDIKGTTFNASTDSLEAIRDRGDAAWLTGAGGAGLTAQETRDAMKLAPTVGAPAAGSVDQHLDDIELDTNDLQTNQGAWATATGFATAGDSMGLTAGAVDAILDEALAGHNVAGSLGKAIRQILEGTVSDESSVSDISATATSFVTALTETTDNHYKDTSLVFIGGALKGQSRPIFGYSGTTKTITLDEAFTEAPSDGDSFIIKTDHVHPISVISDYIDANSTQLAAMILEIAAVKAKTDQLAFTVANQVDSNAKSMNDTAITGAGTAGDPWT